MTIEIEANIKEIHYQHFLTKDLREYSFDQLSSALSSDVSFILKMENKKRLAVSSWVSPKRTRSYPYARVYNTLDRTERKVTIIPIFKDEGKDGDRDFLQWDTISLMSLLDVYVIVSYYSEARKSDRYENKITGQTFDVTQINEELMKLLRCKSSALHWNINQTEKLSEVGEKALEAYLNISEKLNVSMHSYDSALKRINRIKSNLEEFKAYSRLLAKEAQTREILTIQPKEFLDGEKGKIAIKNFLGGLYYFTVDEVRIEGSNIFLIEGKHSKNNKLPSEEDVKDGLIKMILYCNLVDVFIDGKKFIPIPSLKLTVEGGFDPENLSESRKSLLRNLEKESVENNFRLIFE